MEARVGAGRSRARMCRGEALALWPEVLQRRMWSRKTPSFAWAGSSSCSSETAS